MGKNYLIDSNVIIDYTSSLIPQKGSDFVEDLFDNNFFTSVVVKIEVLGFDDVPTKQMALEEFLDTASVLPIDDAVTKQTILLRRKYKKLKLGDALIAATALVHQLSIIFSKYQRF